MFCPMCGAPTQQGNVQHKISSLSLELNQDLALKCFCHIQLQQMESLLQQHQQKMENFLSRHFDGRTFSEARTLASSMRSDSPVRVEFILRLQYLTRLRQRYQELRRASKNPTPPRGLSRWFQEMIGL